MSSQYYVVNRALAEQARQHKPFQRTLWPCSNTMLCYSAESLQAQARLLIHRGDQLPPPHNDGVVDCWSST